MVDERLKQIRELTLMLMYLTSWEDHDAPGLRAVKKKELGSYPLVRRCWKGYDFRLLKDLVEEGLICDSGRTRPAQITSEGESEAKKTVGTVWHQIGRMQVRQCKTMNRSIRSAPVRRNT